MEAMKLEEEKILQDYKTNKQLLHESELKDKQNRNLQKDKVFILSLMLKFTFVQFNFQIIYILANIEF